MSLQSTTAASILILHLILLASARRTPSTTSVFDDEQSDTQGESNEFVLDLNKLDKDQENLVAQINHLASALHICGFSGEMQHMMLFHLGNRSVTCNDGSPAGYYFRQSQGSKKWLIYLEGGWHCHDRDSCNSRWLSSSRLMSSTTWLKTKTGTGILSPDPEENPVFWKSNIVYVPYCSSDVWSGTVPSSEPGSYAFMGALILTEVFKELLVAGLMDAKQILLAGSSAGGTGVMLNLDRMKALLAEAGSSAQLLGLVDSGWFLDQERQASGAECTDMSYCNPAQALHLGTKLWHSLLPKACSEMYGEEQMWKCFFGFRVQQTLQTPLFVFQWLYDEAQLTIGMSGPPIQIEHWNFMQKTGRNMRSSLRNVSAVFAPACYAHIILTRSDWTSIQVHNVRFHKALQCWLKKNEPAAENTQRQSRKQRRKNSRKIDRTVQGDDPRTLVKRSSDAARPKKRCQSRLLDHATCPHCNPTCPKMANPFTGEDMEFLSFMRLFGLDLGALAEQMGLDETTLSMADPATAMLIMAEADRQRQQD